MARVQLARLYTDGGSRGNPGPAAIGIVICDKDDRIIKEFSEYIGRATNNQAEYRALIRGLAIAANYTDGEVICTLDSELVVRQITGVYHVRNPAMEELLDEVRRREDGFRSIKYVHRPRMTGHLARADMLVNSVLDEVMKHPIDDMLRTSITKQVEIGKLGDPEGDIVDAQAVSKAFLDFCVMQGWMIKRGSGGSTKFYITDVGRKELRAFGIDL